MSLLLKDRDYVADGNGGVAVVRDGEALLNEVLFRLAARRGSFPFLPELGSRMERLRREKTSGREILAKQFAVEALDDMEDVTVTDTVVRQEGDRLWVSVSLVWQGEQLSVAVQLEG